jgi:hypothetical protein
VEAVAVLVEVEQELLPALAGLEEEELRLLTLRALQATRRPLRQYRVTQGVILPVRRVTILLRVVAAHQR